MNHSFNIEIAKKYGIEKAVILENFYFWVIKNKANNKNCHDGKYYTYNTAEALAELFPYIKERKIAQLLREMENEDNLLLSGQFFSYDRTKSYTLTDLAMSFFEDSIIQKLDNGESEKCTMEKQEDVVCLNTDINTDVKSNIKTNITTDESIPAYIQKPINKSEYQTLIKNMFDMITKHNKCSKNKIPISKSFIYFQQKECSDVRLLMQQYDCLEIITALENYLKVADADTWKKYFTWNDFIKKINDFLSEYFILDKYLNKQSKSVTKSNGRDMSSNFLVEIGEA